MVFSKKDKDNMIYSVVQTDNTISIHLFPNHIAANPKGYVKLPDVVEDIEKADLQESDHRYKICADILNMSENMFKKKKTLYKYNDS